MPVFEYKCGKCNSVFEHVFSSGCEISCVSCGSKTIKRTDSTIFQPSKFFCPHEGFKKTTAFLLMFSILVTLNLSACRTKDPTITEDYSGIELTYYKVFDDSDIMDPIIQQYEADHPGLDIHYRQFSDFDEYQRTILNEMAEGEGPDIFSMQNTWFTTNYRKLTPMPQAFGTPAGFEKTFVDVAYNDLVRPDDNGQQQVYALPMTVDTLALYYNNEHFEDNIPTRGRPATTWEGIKEDVVLLNKADNSLDRFEVSGISMGRADNISRAVDILYLLFLQHEVDFYNDNISEAVFAGRQGGAFAYPGLEALELYTSFANEKQRHYSWNEYVADDDSEGQEIEAFASGDVSMIIGYSYTYDLIQNYISLLEASGQNAIDKDAIRTAPIPQLYDPRVSSEKRTTYASYFAETVSRNCEYPDIAWDFLVSLALSKNLEYYFEKTNKPTSRRDMIEEQREDPIYGIFASQIGYAESFPLMDYYTYKSIFADVINESNLSGAERGNLATAQDQINALLPEEGFITTVVPTEEAATTEDED